MDDRQTDDELKGRSQSLAVRAQVAKDHKDANKQEDKKVFFNVFVCVDSLEFL